MVELSNDGGSSWSEVENVLLASGGWRRHTFRISDVLPPTSQMRVRFRASDQPNNTAVEVGIDSFLARSFGVQAVVASRNGGTNPVSYSASPAVLGTSFGATVDNGLAGQLTSLLFAFDTRVSLQLGAGQTLLCLDLSGSGELLTGAGLAPVSSAGGVDTYALAIPNDCTLEGVVFRSQAIQFGSPPFALSNAQDLTLGGF